MADRTGPLVVSRDDGLVLSDDPDRLDLVRVVAWLAASYWAWFRTPDEVERSIAGSRTYGVYAPDGTQIALTRAVTDDTTFAWLGDVVVDEAWRGKGVGRWMIGTVVEHLRGLGVPRFVLATHDAHGMYAALGFEPLGFPERWMELDARPDIPPANGQPLAGETNGEEGLA